MWGQLHRGAGNALQYSIKFHRG